MDKIRALFIATFILTVHNLGFCSEKVFFGSDEGYIEAELRETFSLPCEYGIISHLPSHNSKSWSIKYNSERNGSQVFGRLSLVKPEKDSDVCFMKLALDHEKHFSSLPLCLDAVTKALARDGRLLAKYAFQENISIFKARELIVKNGVADLKRFGWDVAVKPNVLGKNGIVLAEYTLPLDTIIEMTSFPIALLHIAAKL